MRTRLFIFLLAVSNMAIFSQQYSPKPITVGEDTFLPYIKGKVINRILENDLNAQKIFAILRSLPSVNTPQDKPGYALTDDKMHEILQNQTIWKRIMQEVE